MSDSGGEPVTRGRRRVIDGVATDLSAAFKALRRAPGHTLVSTITLALGIGANVAVFSVLNAVLLRPLPYADADRVMVLWTANPAAGILEEGTSYATVADWNRMSRSFADMAITTRGKYVVLTDGDKPERVRGDAASANLFDVLGVTPHIGRSITRSEQADGAMVAVISHSLWQRRYGGDAKVLGNIIEVEEHQLRVVGVMPAGFFFPTHDTELWWPVAGEHGSRFSDDYRVIARLRDGVDVDDARAEMASIGASLSRAHTDTPPNFAGFGVSVVPILEQLTTKPLQTALWVLLGSVAFVLVIACVNVANLSIARGTARRAELAVRASLGASRWRLARHLAMEGVLVAAFGGAGGILIGAWCVDALLLVAPASIPRIDAVQIDRGVLAYALAVTIIVIVVFGISPAVRPARIEPADVLRQGNARHVGGTGISRVRALLILCECAFAVVLLTGAGLMLRSFAALAAVDPGFDAENVVVTRVTLPAQRSPDPQQAALLVRQLLDRIEAIPGVASTGHIRELMHRRNNDVAIVIERDRDRTITGVGTEHVSTGAPDALGLRLIAGRPFAADETVLSQVALVNETLARRISPDMANVIGARFRDALSAGSDEAWVTIVGVVGDMRRQGLERLPGAEYFVPGVSETMDVIIRVRRNPARVARAVPNAIRQVDSGIAISSVRTLTDLLADDRSQRQFQTVLLVIFAGIALLLAGVGIWGIMHEAIAQRVREIGIRVALGAQSRSVIWLLIADAMRPALVGVLLGVLAAAATARLARSLLFEVAPTDSISLISAAVLLLAIAAFSCGVPAVRVARLPALRALLRE